jgi:D-alanyl-D-alanine carboxypeptidase
MSVDKDLLRQALAETARDHGPGMYGLVTEGGETVFEGSVGVADLENPRPIVASDRYRIGSVTKVYTAALAMQLVAEGKMSLDDSVERWLPGMVPGGDVITVETLLRLRSGLPDYVAPLWGELSNLAVLEEYWAPEQLVAASVDAPDRLEPDTTFRYSNTDYVLLGMIIEKASGQRVDAQMWQRIFKPLKLENTTFPTVDPHMRGPHAKGYLRFSAEMPYTECTTMTPSESWTSGAIVATAADVARFLDGLLGGALLEPDCLAMMTNGTQFLDEHRTRGLGIVRFDFGTGNIAYGHQGGMPGYTTVAARTESGRSVVLWQNGADVHDNLSSDTPFIQAALAN